VSRTGIVQSGVVHVSRARKKKTKQEEKGHSVLVSVWSVSEFRVQEVGDVSE
jgi:hypothetical protein